MTRLPTQPVNNHQWQKTNQYQMWMKILNEQLKRLIVQAKLASVSSELAQLGAAI